MHHNETIHLEVLRARMVAEQIEARGVRETAVLTAMRTVPRELFVPPPYRPFAYDDTPLPIPAGQTISQPFVVADMIAAMQLQPSDRVLEIGTGSGYAAAVLSRIVAEVYTVERHQKLVHYAQRCLALAGYDNVHVRHSNGTLGWPEHAPYNGILVSAGGPTVPPPLKEQLAINGRLLIPVGTHLRQQQLLCITRLAANHFHQETLGIVAFVPLVGQEGWSEKNLPPQPDEPPLLATE